MQLHSQEVLFFAQIAPYRSFSEAALSLNVPQPTVSRKIIDLESKLGKKLFVRSKNGIELTEFGKRFLTESHSLKVLLTQLAKMGNEDKNSTSIVTVECLPGLASVMLRDFISEFKRNYPSITLDIRTIYQKQQFQKIERFIRLQLAPLDDHSNEFIEYISSKRRIYASPAFVNEHGPLTHPQQIEEQQLPCIVSRMHSRFDCRWSYQNLNHTSHIEVRPILFVDSDIQGVEVFESQKALICAPEILMKKLVKTGKATALFDDKYSVLEQAYIGYSNRKPLTEAEGHFVHALRNFFRQGSRV